MKAWWAIYDAKGRRMIAVLLQNSVKGIFLIRRDISLLVKHIWIEREEMYWFPDCLLEAE